MRKRKPQTPKRLTAPAQAESLGGAGWIYGRHAVLAALANRSRTCHRLVATPAAANTIEAASRAAAVPRPTVEIVEPLELDRLLPPDCVHQGAAMLTDPLPSLELEEVLAALPDHSRVCIVVLDQSTDPRNVGAVLRSAAAFGAAAVVVQKRHAPATTGALAKAASGALECVPLVRVVNIARSLDLMKRSGFWCAGLDTAARESLAHVTLTARVAIVLGSEGKGLRRLVLEACDHLARIPISSPVNSLNVSVAAAIALYEVRRRDEHGETRTV